MRKTLLIAAAALAAGVISSQAGVYSQNIVGYVNVAMTNIAANYFVSIPFTIGQTNGANEIFGTSLPNGTQIDQWNGSGFTVTIYDTDPNGISDFVHHWYMSDDGTITNAPVLPVGSGFLMVPNGTITNTFAGAVAIPVGTSNQMVFTNISANYFVGVAVPYAGALTNGNSSTGGANFNNLPNGSQVDFWNGAGFTVYIYDTDPNGILDFTHHWYMSDDGTITNTPSVVPGQAFLFVPNGDYTWTTGL
jgi:hypothetical protein